MNRKLSAVILLVSLAGLACFNRNNPQNINTGGGLPEDLRSVEEQIIIDALSETKGGRRNVAERLGISERTLRYKIARMREAGVPIPG